MSIPPDDPFAPPPEGTPPGVRRPQGTPPSGMPDQPPPDYIGPPAGYFGPVDVRRFSVGAVALGIVVPLLVLPVSPMFVILALMLQVPFTPAAGLVISVVPVVGGIALAAVGRDPRQRGFGLGLVIGWAVLSVIVAGVCMPMLRDL